MTFVKAKSIAVYVLGLAAVVIGAVPQVGVSASVQATLVAVGGVVVAVERYLQGTAAIVEDEGQRAALPDALLVTRP